MDELLSRERFEAIADNLIGVSAADQTEVVAIGTDSALTRFANSSIHQNVGERNVEIRVRALVGRRQGVATTNDLSDAALRRVAARAVEAARRQPEVSDLPDLAGPAPMVPVEQVPDVMRVGTPERRALLVGTICRLATEARLQASGYCAVETNWTGVANSNGVRLHERTSRANLLTVVLDDEGSGYAEQTSTHFDVLDAEAVGREAVDKGVRSRGAERVEPGEYTVVLEAYAVAEALNYMAYMGFGALRLLSRSHRAAGGRSSHFGLGRRPRSGGPFERLRLRGGATSTGGPDRQRCGERGRLRPTNGSPRRRRIDGARATGAQHLRAVPDAPDHGRRRHAAPETG
jgi:predicted Zn-dependent protease